MDTEAGVSRLKSETAGKPPIQSFGDAIARSWLGRLIVKRREPEQCRSRACASLTFLREFNWRQRPLTSLRQEPSNKKAAIIGRTGSGEVCLLIPDAVEERGGDVCLRLIKTERAHDAVAAEELGLDIA